MINLDNNIKTGYFYRQIVEKLDEGVYQKDLVEFMRANYSRRTNIGDLLSWIKDNIARSQKKEKGRIYLTLMK